MLTVAFEWIGRPLFWMSIVTTATSFDGPWFFIRWTDTTSPTFTPAVRTSDGMCSCVWLVNTAFSWYGAPENGSDPPNTR